MEFAFHFSEIIHSYGIMTARLLLAVVFLYSGQDKLRHWHASVAEVAALGMPLPASFAAATIAIQIAGGLSLVFGLAAAAGASLLALFTVAATLLGHRFWLLHGIKARHEFTTSLEHLAIVGGLMMVVVDAFASA